jgi:hypothetical protein
MPSKRKIDEITGKRIETRGRKKKVRTEEELRLIAEKDERRRIRQQKKLLKLEAPEKKTVERRGRKKGGKNKQKESKESKRLIIKGLKEKETKRQPISQKRIIEFRSQLNDSNNCGNHSGSCRKFLCGLQIRTRDKNNIRDKSMAFDKEWFSTYGLGGGYNYLTKRMIVLVDDAFDTKEYCQVEIISINQDNGLITCSDFFGTIYKFPSSIVLGYVEDESLRYPKLLENVPSHLVNHYRQEYDEKIELNSKNANIICKYHFPDWIHDAIGGF